MRKSFVLFILCAFVGFFIATNTAAQTGEIFTVNDISDAGDASVGDGACSTLGAVCTLRAALQEANAFDGTDTIVFNISGTGVHTFTPATPLPSILESVTINGYSQPGSSGATASQPATITIALQLPDSDDGLHLNVGGVVIRGLKISGAQDGIVVENGSSSTIAGNHIVENIGYGIRVTSDLNTIGGATPVDRNVISGNGQAGVRIEGAVAIDNVVRGNYIGIDAAGETAFANGEQGVVVADDARAAISDNVISGNTGDGVFMNEPSWESSILRNIIGLNATETAAVPNGGNGVTLVGISQAGSTTPGDGNVIAGNSGHGIEMETMGTAIWRNWIGTNRNLDSGLGNGGYGVYIHDSSENLIGGEPNANTIAYNALSGVYVENAGENRIQGNSIFDNDSLGIELGPNAHDGQPAPTLTSIEEVAGEVLISGTVTNVGTGSSMVRLDFYANAVCDPSGSGEGQTHLGFVEVQTVSQTAVFNDLAFPIVPDQGVITATVTSAGPSAGTSPFSNCVGSHIFTVNVVDDAADTDTGDGVCSADVNGESRCTLRAAIEQANATSGVDFVYFNIPGVSAHVLTLESALPTIVDTVTIDGYSQPGSIPANPTQAATITIVLDFDSNAGLELESTYSLIRGLQISNAVNGITLGGVQNVVEGSSIINNLDSGILVTGEGGFIGGLTPSTRNIISNNDGSGITVTSTAVENVIQGNRIGVNAMGDFALPNGEHGIFVNGGDQTGIHDNVISGNTSSGVVITGSATLTAMLRNIIGLSAGESATIPNQEDGIVVDGANGVNIGVGSPGTGNVIAGNADDGIDLITSNTSIRGNWIGTNKTYSSGLGNGSNGIRFNVSNENWIGGAPHGNTIAYNTLNGIYGQSGIQNRIEGNSIYSNGQMGILLQLFANEGAGAVTLIDANAEGDGLLVGGLVQNGPTNTTVHMEFFANVECDTFTNSDGEGQTYLGYVDVATDDTGSAAFADVVLDLIPGQNIITATATSNERGTSAFSNCRMVMGTPPPDPADAMPNRNVYLTDRPTLTWGGVTWAVSYEIEVSTTPTFTGIPTHFSTVAQVQTNTLADGMYYWRVRAVRLNNTTGAWSVMDSFVVDTTP